MVKIIASITFLMLITASANAAPLKFVTELEYQDSFSGSSTLNNNIDASSTEFTLALKYQPTPWLQIIGGMKRYDETSNAFGQPLNLDVSGAFINIQTVTVIADF